LKPTGPPAGRKTRGKSSFLRIAFYIFLIWIGYSIRWVTERSSCKSAVDKRSPVGETVNTTDMRRRLDLETDERRTSNCTCSAFFQRMVTRVDLMTLMNQARLIGEGVEIGVRDGEFSDATLSRWNGIKLHLVDPWLEQDSKIYNDISNVAQNEQNARFELVSKNMKDKFPGRYKIHRNLSTEAVKNFQDRSLDYVYIDARSRFYCLVA
jgi:hypothetical protein